MCGITAVALSDARQQAAPELLEAIYTLQHRGQDSCGIATSLEDRKSFRRRDIGLVSEVFGGHFSNSTEQLIGNLGIAHVRYSTTQSYTRLDAQPLYTPAANNVFLAHNGHLINEAELQNYLKKIAFLPANRNSDSEHILCVFATALEDEYSLHKDAGIAENAFSALKQVYKLCVGSYACVAMFSGSILGFRDPHGIKPLLYGERRNQTGQMDFMFSSESITLEKLGYRNLRDVRPGEAILLRKSKSGIWRTLRRQISPMLSYTPDIFEYVYFARPENTMDGINVHRARQLMGVALARTIKDRAACLESVAATVDVVMPVPDTSMTAALAVAQYLNKPFSHGLIRNRYIFRTFIMPQKSPRMKGVWRKLTAVKEEFKGKIVLLVDDSIVRGNTAIEIVQMARDAGAKKVILASCCPPIRYNHIHGIDLADQRDLVAHCRTEEQVGDVLGCDEVIYLPLNELVFACLQASKNPEISSFEDGIFTGRYVTGPVDFLPVDIKTKNKKLGIAATETPFASPDGCADFLVEEF